MVLCSVVAWIRRGRGGKGGEEWGREGRSGRGANSLALAPIPDLFHPAPVSCDSYGILTC